MDTGDKVGEQVMEENSSSRDEYGKFDKHRDGSNRDGLIGSDKISK